MNTVIFANGKFGAQDTAARLCRQAGLIIAVDGGLRHCKNLSIQPHILLGDLDSAPEELIQQAITGGVELQCHPRDKDKTDLELALDLACERGATKVSLFGGLGGRWDMSLANLFLLATPNFDRLQITVYDELTKIDLLRTGSKFTISATSGSRVSLIPITAAVEGVTLNGFQYPLIDQTLSFASTRGLSNVLTSGKGWVEITGGRLFCILDESV